MTNKIKNDVPDGYVLLERHNEKPRYAACLDGGRFHGWLFVKGPEDGQWVSERKLESWEVMQAEDQRDYAIVQETNAAATPESAAALTSDQQAGAVATLQRFEPHSAYGGPVMRPDALGDWLNFEEVKVAIARPLTAPAAIEQAGAQPVASNANVMSPFAGPASQHDAEDSTMGALCLDVMNIPCDESKANEEYSDRRIAYKHGHRDARHAAADLVSEFAGRFRAQGGNTNGSTDLTAPTSATDQDALDAKRYRWLRAQPFDTWKRIGWNTWGDDPAVFPIRDEDIDAALAATPVTDQPKQENQQ